MPLIVDSSTAADSTGSAPRDPVTLGDITFGQVDGFGVEWILSTFGGWTDSAPSTGGSQQRAADHGAWIDGAYYGARVLTMEGYAVAGSWDAAEAAGNRLLGAVPLSMLEPLVVGTSIPRQVLVRQEGQPLVEVVNHWARFSLSLLAPDPRRYSVAVTTVETGLPTTTGGLSLPLSLPLSIGATVASGVLTATNSGNMATRPTLTVYGPVGPFSITHRGTGQVLRFHESIPAGRRLVLDTDRRRALLDGTAGRRVTGSWFEYAPGDNEVAFAADYNEDARLVSEHRSAWR